MVCCEMTTLRRCSCCEDKTIMLKNIIMFHLHIVFDVVRFGRWKSIVMIDETLSKGEYNETISIS